MPKRHDLALSLGLILTFGAANYAAAALPTALGFSALPNTKIRSVCAADHGFPQVGGNDGCPGITLAWNGGVFDTARNRMIVWGGGHRDYEGNEIYAINLDTQTIERITDPGLPTASSCTEAIAGGTQPNSRHTYDGIEYVPGADKMFVFGGSLACSTGEFGADTWMFSFATKTWQRMNPSGTNPRAIPGIVTAYDPNTGLVFLYDDLFFYSYNPSTNAYTRLTSVQQAIGYHLNATIDPVRKKFIMVGFDSVAGGGRVWSVDIAPGSTYSLQQVATNGGSAIIGTLYPGVAYDPVADRIVGWSDNTPNVVYSLNLDTRQWTATSASGGPTPAGNGTHGRWRYSPTSNAFVLVNRVDDDVLIYRASTAGGGAPDTQAPSTPTALAASAVSSTQVNSSWSPSTDNVGVTGYRVYRCPGAGCLPSVLAASPTGTTFTDTGLLAATTYRYAVTAVDAAGNASGLAAAVGVTTPAGSGGGGSSADADFAARCSAAGVVTCVAFDNTTTDIVNNLTVFPDAAGNIRAGLDTTQKTSGAGALRFDLPPPPHGGANIGGSWTLQSAGVFGRTFSENSTFYVQFRQRLSSEMATNSWGGATWKTVIFHYNNTTCGAIELTTSNYYGAPLAQMNTDCGARHMYTTLDGSTYTESPPLLQQQGDYTQCAYGSVSAANCFYWPANEWVTVYYKIHVGTWDQPNSSVEVWAAREGSTAYKQFVRVPNIALSCNTDPCSASPGKQQGYNNLTFTPYMTGLSSSTGPATTAHMWIDELVISTQPIAAPLAALAPRPMPPTSVTAQ